MNKRNIIILVIIAFFVILCLSCLWIFRDELSIRFLNNKDLDNTSNENINNETTDNAPIIHLDNSEKVAKLYNLPDNKYNNKQYVKEISQNEVNKIDNMLKSNEIVYGILEFINTSDYFIEFNNNSKESIEFRIADNHILAIVDTITTYIIYKENDVRQLLEILGAKLKDDSIYTEIDIRKIDNPPTLYINNIYEAILISNIWKDEKGSMLAVDMNVNVEELLKDKEFVSSGFGPTISINEGISKNELMRLPSTAKITYAIHKGKEIILAKEAERMINGTYHLDKPNIKGEYIYVVNLTFTNIPNIEALYYFKYVL